MEAADEINCPVILQGSAGARKYAGEPFLRHLIEAAVEAYPHIPVSCIRITAPPPAVCFTRIRSGFSVMMDGSLKEDCKTPVQLRIQRRHHRATWSKWRMPSAFPSKANWAAWARWNPAWRAKKTATARKASWIIRQLLTDPDEAAEFVKKTGVDALAIAIGTSHGAYKFTRPPTGEVLRIDRIKEIHARIPNTHLVMHGSSSVPQEWLKIINEFGGDMGETYGVPVEEIVEGIKHGVRKVNIDTDLRMASTGAIRRYLAENPKNFDPRKFLGDHQGDEGNLQGALRSLRLRRPGRKIKVYQPGRDAEALRQGRTRSGGQLGRARGPYFRCRRHPGADTERDGHRILSIAPLPKGGLKPGLGRTVRRALGSHRRQGASASFHQDPSA